MRYGIPLLGNRVAPRCRCADGILIVVAGNKRGSSHRWMPLKITGPHDLIAVLKRHRVDAVVCGGISREERETLASCASTVIENVACSVGEALAALEDGSLRSGFGFYPRAAGNGRSEPERPASRVSGESTPQLDCIRCRDRKCIRGERCALTPPGSPRTLPAPVLEMLEAATDVSSEDERQLCRLSELVYFCLEMDYRKIGIAYCVDLQEPAEILAGVLERSFETVGVCCKISATTARAALVSPISCDPVAQARLLNQAGTDLNVIVGLCMGADCVFTRESEAPVTTLFVKDKSLANNPIGAVYSEYYLRESVSSPNAVQESSERPAWWKDEITHRGSHDASGREERS